MSHAQHVFPLINVRDVAPVEPKKKAHRQWRCKYDHAQMVVDRLGGMSWMDIAIKHNVTGSSGVSQLLLNSTYVRKLPPEIVCRLEGVRCVG